MDTVATSSGWLRVDLVDGLVHARGVPYARAARFQAPQPLHTPQVGRDATSRGPVCPQTPSRLEAVTGPVVEGLVHSEDCHVVSVTAPAGAKGLPVMVWFHGGAYLSGGGEAPKYDTDDLARHGVVTVNVTYRLGVFGYLTPESATESNLGLRDQIAALEWVRHNIVAFGGDPARVTIFGQSAGADSVIALTAATAGRGLFTRAIVQSAPLGLLTGRGAMTEALRQELTTALAALPDGSPGAATHQDLLDIQERLVGLARRFGRPGGLPFAPVYGEDPLPSDWLAALQAAAADVELFIGCTRDDAAPFVAAHPAVSRLARGGALGRAGVRGITRRVTASTFCGPSDDLAAVWRRAGGRVARYRFGWRPAGSALGASHCIELPFIFSGDWRDAPMLGSHDVSAQLQARVRRVWTDFAGGGVEALPTAVVTFD